MTLEILPSLLLQVLQVLSICSKTLCVHICRGSDKNTLRFTTFNNSLTNTLVPYLQIDLKGLSESLAIPDWINHCFEVEQLINVIPWLTKHKKSTNLVQFMQNLPGTVKMSHDGTKMTSYIKVFSVFMPGDPANFAQEDLGTNLLDTNTVQMALTLKTFEDQPLIYPPIPSSDKILQVTYAKDYIIINSSQAIKIKGKTKINQKICPWDITIDARYMSFMRVIFDKNAYDHSTITHYKTPKGLYGSTKKQAYNDRPFEGISDIFIYFPNHMFKQV